MKKRFVCTAFLFVLALSSITIAYAGYPAVSNVTQSGYVLGQALGAQGNLIVDVDCNASNFEYKVSIGYGTLSDICAEANGIGITCSLYYNSAQNVYVIRVHDRKLFGLVNTYGCIANANGYIYTAERETSSSNPDITVPTNPDYTDRLLEIASDLDFIPIIAELNVLIADNQTLLMEYIKLAIESIWDFENSMINHIDDFNTAVNNRLAYLGAKTASIDSLLSSVVTDGKVQVDVSSLDWKLDRLLSMYTEVNSVEFDTAAFDGSTGSIAITNAAGGAVSDLVFWGEPYSFGYNERLFYSLNNQMHYIDSADGSYIPLYGLVLGTSIPESVSSSYTLSAGVWQRSDGQYVISDTYEAKTGRLIRRTQFDTDGNLVVAASPQEVLCPSHTMILPAGNSSFFEGFGLRITFNYDQLGGVTKTADIISAINNIPAYDDSTLVSAVTTISDQITEQFGEYDSAYAFPNVLHGETSTQKLYGVLPSSFSEVPDNSDLLYSSSSSVQVYGSLIETSSEGNADYYYEKCVPAYSASYGLYYSFSVKKGVAEPCTSALAYETMPVSFSVTDLGGTAHSFERSFSFALYKGDAFGSASFYVYPSWDSDGTWKGWYTRYKAGFKWFSAQLTTDGEPAVRLFASLPETDLYYLYSKTSEAVPVVYASRFTGFLQAQADRLVNAIGTGGAGGSGIFVVDLAPITTRLDLLIQKSNETVVNVINDNTYVPGVLHLDDSNGVVDTTKDGVSLFGDLVRWLWKNVFDGAFDAADITKLDGLFYDPTEVTADGS